MSPAPTAAPGHLSPALAAAALLGLLVAATAMAGAADPTPGSPPPPIVRAERPSSDYYLALDRGGHTDHHVLYFGVDAEALASLRAADVLLLGNSRLMFAARPGVLDRFFASRGLRYYALGFGFREADQFPLALIEKFDLRPRMVIVNADGFFADTLSAFGRTVMDDTRFGAWKRLREAEATHEWRRVVHQLVPNWLDAFGRPGFPKERELVVYRSRSTGVWELSPWPDSVASVGRRDPANPPLEPVEVAAARRFKAAMDARGIRTVLTYVPTPRPLGGGPAHFARLLDVPLLWPEPAGLRTVDGDHLDEPSAVAWSEAFVARLDPLLP